MGQSGYLTFGWSFASIFALPTSSRVVTTQHVSVLLNETLEGLGIKPGGRYIDGTVGGGAKNIASTLSICRYPQQYNRTDTLRQKCRK